MFNKGQLEGMFGFWGGDNKDPFTKTMRIILTIAYFTSVIGYTLTGPSINANEGWQDVFGGYLLVAGSMTILVGHVLLGYASYRKDKRFTQPNQAPKHMFKSIFLYIYLPAIILTAVLMTITILAGVY